MPAVLPQTGRADDLRKLVAQEIASALGRSAAVPGRSTHLQPEDLPASKPRSKSLEVWNGSVCIRIYRTRWYSKPRRKNYWKQELRWFDAGKRYRKCMPLRSGREKEDQAAAKQMAEQIAGAISTGQTNRLQFSQADIASLLRCRELLVGTMGSRTSATSSEMPGPGRTSIELAISQYVTWIQKLGSPAAVDHALQFFLQHQPKNVTPKNTPELAQEMLANKETNGRGHKWLKELAGLLKFWTDNFKGPIYSIRAHEIKARLNEARVSLRTRKNRLAALSELVRFAKSEGQLAHTWNELSLLDKIELPPVEVESYTPEQLSQLLDAARPNLIPLIVLQAFGGVRHEEVQKMDWRDINLKNGFIRIKSIVGKTKKMRLIQMQPNLVAWLRIYAKTNGPICPITHTSNAIVRTKQRAGLPAGRGQLTNALRSGFGSHRLAQTNDIGLVAREMGNSPNIIKEHYLELVSPDEAKAWFNLWPKKHANVIDWDKADLPFNKNRSQIDPQQKTAS